MHIRERAILLATRLKPGRTKTITALLFGAGLAAASSGYIAMEVVKRYAPVGHIGGTWWNLKR